MNSEEFYEIEKPTIIHSFDCYERFKEYYGFYRCVSEEDLCKFPYPAHFILFHAVELYLKACASFEGASIWELQHNFGHKILRILDERCSESLRNIEDFRKLVCDLEEMNKNYEFRYPAEYYYDYIFRGDVINCIDNVLVLTAGQFFLVRTRAHTEMREIKRQAGERKLRWAPVRRG